MAGRTNCRIVGSKCLMLSRLSDLSEVLAKFRVKSRDLVASEWCPGPELNRYVSFETRDFKSRASASFATRAGMRSTAFYRSDAEQPLVRAMRRLRDAPPPGFCGDGV